MGVTVAKMGRVRCRDGRKRVSFATAPQVPKSMRESVISDLYPEQSDGYVANPVGQPRPC